VAFDAVCCQILGIDPLEVEHIRRVHEMGFGPVSLDDIDISGDVSLAEARERAKDFKHGLIRVERYFEGTHITAYAGKIPAEEGTDYCWGGCPGALEEAIEILRLVDAECDDKLPRMHVVFGQIDAPLEVGPGEKVVFVGDCASYEGPVQGELIKVENLYRDGRDKDPRTARDEDIFKKMLRVRKVTQNGKADVVRLTGCPVSVAEQVLTLALLGKLENPYEAPEVRWHFGKNYLSWRAHMLGKRLTGVPYQRGEVARGDAMPASSRGAADD
jgi:hypothetical protein